MKVVNTAGQILMAGAGGAADGGIFASAAGSSQSAGLIIWSNSNNVSFGMNGSTITGSASFAQTTQSAIKAFGASNTGNTAGNTGVSTGVDWILAGSNSITISESTAAGGPNTLWIQMTMPAGAGGIAASAAGASASAGTVVWSNSNNVSFGMAGSTITATASFAQTTQSAIKAFGASNTGNTAGNTGVSTGIDWILAGSNMVTVSESTAIGGPNTLWLNATQSVQAESFSVGVSTGGNTSGNTTVNSGTRLVFVGSNNITLSQGTAAGATTITISGPTTAAQTNQSAIKAFGISNTGNTAGNTGVSTGIDWVIAASGNITASESTVGGGPNTAWLSVPAQSSQSAIKGFGASNTGSTAGNTGISTGVDWVLAGSNNITISGSTVGGGPNTLWVSGANAGVAQFSVGVSTLGNTSGNTGVTGTRIVFQGTNNITLSQATDATGATIVISGPNAGGGGTGHQFMVRGVGSWSTNAGLGQSSVFVMPMFINGNYEWDRALLYMSNSMSTSSNSSYAGTVGLHIGIYSNNAGTLSLATSSSVAYQFTITGNTSSISYQGFRVASVPFAATMTPNDYWVAVMTNSSTANANWFTWNLMCYAGIPNTAFSGELGQSTATSKQYYPGFGTWSAQTATLPNSIDFHDLRHGGNALMRSQPIIAFASGTVV